jgi:hypothetical protein
MLHDTSYLALTPGGIETGPGFDQWYPLGYLNFGAKIETTFTVTTAGNYSFGTYSDDGSALYIDGQIVVNNGNEHAPTAAFASMLLNTGPHQLLVEYYEGQPLINANLTAYMSPTPVPEPAFYISGALLVCGASAVRSRHKNRSA